MRANRIASVLTALLLAGATSLVAPVASAAPTPENRFDTGLGPLVGLAFDPASGNVFVYPDFEPGIHEFTPAGAEVPPAIPRPGLASNDFDLDVAPEEFSITGDFLPAGSLLVTNGESTPYTLFALDPATGTIRGEVGLAVNAPVGGSYHPGRGTFFVVEWTTDQIQEVDLDTGQVVNTIPVTPAGSPAFDVFYGDVAVGPTGDLFVVSDAQNKIRQLTATGSWVADYDVGFVGVTQMSAVDIDPATGDAWIADKTGLVHQVSDLSQGVVAQNATVDEGDTDLVFTVSLAAITPNQSTITVDFATSAGSATSGSDFQPQTGTLTFAPGETSKTVSVRVAEDAIVEADETVFLDLSNPSGAPIGVARATATIVDDDRGTGPGCSDPNVICGSDASETIEGTAGNDIIIAGGGNDTIIGGGGVDEITGGAGKDVITGDGATTAAARLALARRGVNVSSASAAAGFADSLFGGGGADRIFGGGGADTIKGGGGDDKTYGDDGGDVMAGGGANDLLNGGLGKDKMNGNKGVDHCFKGSGDTVTSCESLTRRHR